MEPLILVLALAAGALAVRIAVFESVFGVLVGAPILFFLLAQVLPAGAFLYIAVLVILSLLAWFLQDRKKDYDRKEQFVPIAVFAGAYIFFYSLCLLWPDFIAMGERLRDYAILSSILESPIVPREPWLSGYTLNYYVFWYRFGHMFHAIFGMPVWQVYHSLQSFTYSLYFASAFVLCNRVVRMSVASSLFCSVIICLGSNIEGVIYAMTGDDNWWGPSRVIKGAITEFPAWSFLLGDLHPHYLNLPATAFLPCMLIPALDFPLTQIRSVFLGTLAFILMPLFLYNSNAWEVPMWIAIAGSAGVILLLRHYASLDWDNSHLKSLRNPRSICVVVLMLLAAVSLYLSSRHIIPADAPLTRVKPPVAESTLPEMFRHFGFPLALIAIGNILLIRRFSFALMAAILVGSTLLYSEAALFLFAILCLSIFRVYTPEIDASGAGKREECQSSDRVLALEALGIAAVALVLLPEFVFVNDAYGGENERMNLIFKIYTFVWLPLHLYSFFLVTRVIRMKPVREVTLITRMFQIAIVIIMTQFFFTTVSLRMSRNEVIEPASRGLGGVNKEFPGAAAAITRLEALPQGITLEGQGNPYSYTTHVATLAGKESFLGWINHVQLLNRADKEIERRNRITEDFYKSGDCAKRKELVERENISYAVVGPLENAKYPGALTEGFDCLKLLIEEGQYRIYGR